MTTTVDRQPTRIGMKRLVQYGLLTVLVAVVANTLVRVIALSVIVVPASFLPLGWVSVIGSTTIGAVGATAVYGMITRVSYRPNRTFTVVAAIVLVLSFGLLIEPPPVLATASASVLATLAVMHVIPAVVSVAILTRGTDHNGQTTIERADAQEGS